MRASATRVAFAAAVSASRCLPHCRSILSAYGGAVNGEDEFEWDDNKSRATLAERGFGFEVAARIFAGVYLEREDLRQDYGERRFVVIGEFQGIVLTVAWTPRGNRRRIITAWRASNRERREYRDYREAVNGADSQGETSH
ncbi:MAG TPA: BrnT family toxin [Chloroflexota bacterium]|nr:BrnT family toxin [Chloroflexota bacterium]